MNEVSQQIDSRINIIDDRDQPLAPKALRAAIKGALADHGAGSVSEIKEDGCALSVTFMSPTGAKHVFFAKAVSFLGGHGNHPTFKKRIQLPNWFKSGYKTFTAKGYKVHFLGVYHYEGNVVFVDYDVKSYLSGKFNNCSAFVYVSDLYRAMKDGVSSRMCANNHFITTIRCDKFFDYLTEAPEPSSCGELVEAFDLFNHAFPFGLKIEGQGAIKFMCDVGWPKWRETEWPGWFLEYEFALFLSEQSVENIVYQGNAAKKKNALDFDLYFPKNRFYGDLKASDIGKKEAPGNDWQSVHDAVCRNDRFWYVVYEHETEKDADFGNPVTRFRAQLVFSTTGETISPLSYAARMKKSVTFKRMMILEINRANFCQTLGVFHQGHQPDGSARAKKVLIKKRDIDNYLVYKYPAFS